MFAGWMQSTPALLHWFLEQRPPGFPTKLMSLSWILISAYLNMYLMSTDTSTAELGFMSATMTVGMEYQQTFCSDRALRPFTALGCTTFQRIASCQSSVLAKLFWIEPELITTPERLHLLHNPAFEYAALLQVAGGCQFGHQQHMKEQRQEARLAVGSRARGSSRGSSGTTTSSSSSSRAGTIPISSFAQLVVPPDHDLVATALGKEAVAAHARAVEDKLEIGSDPGPGLHSYLDQGARALLDIWNVVVESRMQNARNSQSAAAADVEAAADDVDAAASHLPGSAAAPTAACSVAAAVAVSGAPAASSARVSLTTPAAAAAAAAAGEGVLSDALSVGLLLEVLVVSGALMEKLGDVLECVDLPMLLLDMAAAMTSFDDRRAFITARGGFLMEALGVLLKVVEQEQQRGADHEMSRDIVNHVLPILKGCLHTEDASQVCGFCKRSC